MSEFQGYAFRAIDRPLDRDAMDELRGISTRAEITPTSFSNFYTFGNFKGDEVEMMSRWFDLFVYVANWGNHRVMFRIPGGLLDRETAAAYEADPTVSVRETEDGDLLIDLDASTEDDGDWLEEDDADRRLAALMPVREGLLSGDLRALYLGWLAALQQGEVDDDEPEPPVPAGMGKLPLALAELAGFLFVGDSLIEAAAAASPRRAAGAPAAADMLAWVKSLPAQEKDDLLLSLMKGDDPHLGRELVRRFRRERAPGQEGAAPGPPRRTAGELRAAWEGREELARQEEEQAAARRREKQQREAAERRARRLDSLVGQDEKLWRQVEEAVASRVPKRYDEAVGLLEDLRDLAARAGGEDGWRERVAALRGRHAGKRTFLARLDRAGLAR